MKSDLNLVHSVFAYIKELMRRIDLHDPGSFTVRNDCVVLTLIAIK